MTLGSAGLTARATAAGHRKRWPALPYRAQFLIASGTTTGVPKGRVSLVKVCVMPVEVSNNSSVGRTEQDEKTQILRRDLQRFGGFGRRRAILPQNRRATLRADHRIVGVLQDQDPVGHTDAQRAT